MGPVANPVRQKVDAIADIHHSGEQRVTRHQRFVEAIAPTMSASPARCMCSSSSSLHGSASTR